MTVAAPAPSLAALLSTLTTSLTSTKASLPLAPPDAASGISLLDLKNDVFLSYLHHLSYLLLFRIRNGSLNASSKDGNTDKPTNSAIGEELVKTLASLRLWLEKGVKPCENKLKYQVEKVLKAASEWEREQARKLKEAEEGLNNADSDSDNEGQNGGSDGEDDDDEDADSDEEITSEESGDERDLPKNVNYDSDDLLPSKHSKSSSSTTTTATMKNALAYRPNPLSLSKPTSASLPSKDSKAPTKDGIYRPPKLNPTSMPLAPTETAADPDARRKGDKERKQKARVIDDYISSMATAAPVAEPSIGSNVGRLGRTKTTREREEERERRDYEESNFVRLPGLSKKEKREKNRGGRKEWGGEDWGSIERGMGLDRIERLTKRRGGNGESSRGGGRGGVLERSRKRGGEEFRGGDLGIGERFEKRRKTVDRERRKRMK
ncbi:hypothetical protein H072_10129 [Dactylellina haptotyla CBS 200.50]|uniref:Sas10 C-terminal domain-containing protein n=1 Tax=Dactylellina haptotyla (strain CBS 200.50) TaxID=1284197 RepID=S8A0Z9_DACHA|nr:hypothetical protein H072_10129 [Dactylellina haptotyla CBS 200.50]